MKNLILLSLLCTPFAFAAEVVQSPDACETALYRPKRSFEQQSRDLQALGVMGIAGSKHEFFELFAREGWPHLLSLAEENELSPSAFLDQYLTFVQLLVDELDDRPSRRGK